MDLNGLYSAREGRRAEGQGLVGTSPPRAVFTDPCLWSSDSVEGNGILSSLAPTQPASVGLEPTPPESKEPLGQPRTPIGDLSTMNTNTNQDER